MSGHTPGPWVVGNTDPLLFGQKQGNGTEPIGFVYGPSFPERSEVGQRALANARLIAATPELLEALKDIRNRAALDSVMMKVADDAIAKAEGKS